MVIFDKGLLLALDQGSKEEDGLLDNPLVEGAGGDLGYGDVYLLGGAEGDAWMGERASVLVSEDVGELLETDLYALGSLVIVGNVGGVAPCLEELGVFPFEALESTDRVLGEVLPVPRVARRGERVCYEARPEVHGDSGSISGKCLFFCVCATEATLDLGRGWVAGQSVGGGNWGRERERNRVRWSRCIFGWSVGSVGVRYTADRQ